ncbi:ABC transporter ATP-binding protein [Adlercreutzia sp. ZJ154]|uniref:ABC transporter ATP-binding protein n=1 Tax=Adlercreutzia sp. ZJ154 TaxID=2709790 RepID=UPI001F150CA7|nr:ABC transporter ATP-binding protein [Adlercreutzia sp. ZJ154]
MSDQKTPVDVRVESGSGALAFEKAVVRKDVEHVETALAEEAEACGVDSDSTCETPESLAAEEALEKKFAGTDPIIFLDDIKVTFKTRTGSLLHPNMVQAVRGLTLKLWPGETIGIVGESGCGKSTTANVMCGLQSPTSGKVYFKGKDVTHRSAADRRIIGRVISVVFQDPATALNARMSVHDQLMDPMIVHKVGTTEERERRVHELIGMVGLPESALDALPGQLSGGQRQRVAIARALSLKPDAIIADEPTSALDVSVRAQILNLLMDLKKELNLAMVFISHDIQTVRYISDRIIVMNAGRAVEEGTAEQVFNNPQDDYTRLLLGAAPSLLHPDLGK